MTNKKTIKLSILAVLMAIVMIFSIACKNKQTASTSLSGEMPIELTQGIEQFMGKTFKSVDALEESVGSYLWVKISEDSTIKYQASGNTEPDFSISKEVFVSQGMGENYVFQGKAFASGEQAGTLKFQPDGTLTVKFISGNSYVGKSIECKLVK